MEFWSFGVLEFWSFEVLEFWSFGVLEFGSFGILEFWSFGVLEFEALEFWSFGVLEFWSRYLFIKILTFTFFIPMVKEIILHSDTLYRQKCSIKSEIIYKNYMITFNY